MDPLYEALQRLGLVAFVHPHYGMGNEHFGDAGHSLFLALGEHLTGSSTRRAHPHI
jgi:hypothetical protein